jgi:hypothetical protein
VGDSEVPIEFDAERPVLTLTRADLHGPAEFWARSNGVVAAALVTESETDGPTTDCVEASAVAGIAALPLSASGWTSARLYVATRVGERGPFVAGLRAPGNDRATATPEPIAPRARDEAAAFWRIRERPCAEDQPCGEEEFVIEGAFTYAWSRAVESARADCGAWTRDDGRPERFGFSCGQSLWRGVSVRVADREVVLLERTGTDLSPAGRPRVLRRIAIPPGVRLVPRAMGLLSWDHPAEPRQDS